MYSTSVSPSSSLAGPSSDWDAPAHIKAPMRILTTIDGSLMHSDNLEGPVSHLAQLKKGQKCGQVCLRT